MRFSVQNRIKREQRFTVTSSGKDQKRCWRLPIDVAEENDRME